MQTERRKNEPSADNSARNRKENQIYTRTKHGHNKSTHTRYPRPEPFLNQNPCPGVLGVIRRSRCRLWRRWNVCTTRSVSLARDAKNRLWSARFRRVSVNHTIKSAMTSILSPCVPPVTGGCLCRNCVHWIACKPTFCFYFLYCCCVCAVCFDIFVG